MLNFDGYIGYCSVLMGILVILKILMGTPEINSKEKGGNKRRGIIV
jgi:hypothetical protein